MSGFVLTKSPFPQEVIKAINIVSRKLHADCWLVGGTVRDWLLERQPKDIDITVSISAFKFSKTLITELGKGTLVPLGTDDEEACRVVLGGFDVDISSFRGPAKSIEEDLRLRDFTLNALGLPFVCLTGQEVKLIDPLDGAEDIAEKVLTDCPDAFVNDPLRILRGYRFQATLGFSFSTGVEERISDHLKLFQNVASERVAAELDIIVGSSEGADVCRAMYESGLLQEILPELTAGAGLEQPGFHHLDVMHHAITTLEKVLFLLNSEVEISFLGEEELRQVRDSEMKTILCWAALLHDIGKPVCHGFRESDSRVTFYNHDEVGSDLVDNIGRRLRWSNDRRESVKKLVRMHMHPFHLCTVQQKGEITKKAALKLYRRAKELLVPLFILAMADSMASEGVEKPSTMEEDLASLFRIVMKYYREYIIPVVEGEKLLTGKDLIATFNLAPGPVIGKILNNLQEAQVADGVASRDEALVWVAEYIKKQTNIAQ